MWSLVLNDAVHMNNRNPGRYELLAMTGRQAIDTLFPVWDDATDTFVQRLQKIPALPKSEALAASLNLEAPMIVCARRRIGKPEDVIVFDGCSRIMAIAIRASWGFGWRLPPCVGVFVEIR